MRLRVALELGRVSNLPTVWTNTLAGVVLAGGGIGDARLPWLLVALSSCYVAGMFLNDAFDREFDARHRPDRPIAAGQVTARTVFTAGFALLATGVLLLGWTGYGFENGTGVRPLLAGLALAAAIVFYDWHHKQNPLSPVVMGLCRMLVYVAAAYAISPDPPVRVFLAGALLLSYLVGLTYLAKQEHLDRVGSLWPLVFLALPLAWGAAQVMGDPAAAVPWLLLVAWLLYALSTLRRRRPGDVPRAVGSLLAGICLWDGLVMSVAGQPWLAALALVAFLLTLLMQRFVAPT